MVLRLTLIFCGFLGVLGLFFLAWRSRQATYGGANWRFWLTAILPFFILTPIALWAVRPYCSNRLIGAGDSHHYALQVADFVTQARQGVMPVFVGQSAYAFNGNVHTLRTAPYFTHLAGVIDWVTIGKLGFVELQNLAVCLTSLAAAWAAYLACLRLSGGLRLASLTLSALYVVSPAVIGPLMLQDMFATYMTAPWLVLVWAGLIAVLNRDDPIPGQILAAGALGMVWLAHPAVAGWLTLVWVGVQCVQTLREGGSIHHWRGFGLACLLLAGVSAYVFASVAALESRPYPPVFYYDFGSTWTRLLQECLIELGSDFVAPDQATVRLGAIGLIGLITAIVTLVWRHWRGGWCLAAAAMILLACLLPVPAVSKLIWAAIPERLLVLSTWPAQRLAPLLMAGAVVTAAAALSLFFRRRTPTAAYYGTCLTLACLASWQAAKTSAIQQRKGMARLELDIYAPLFSPQNLRLTRYSYDLFARTPGYFTHGWSDPEFESRLLDAEFGLQADMLPESPSLPEAIPVHPQIVRDLPGPARYLLAFDMKDATAVGEISVHAPGINRSYTLPSGGEPLSFGSGPFNARTTPLRLLQPGPNPVTILSSVPGVAVRIVPLDESTLPVKLLDLTPYTAAVRSRGPGYLETPKVYLPGYLATVNGHPVPVRRSANNLVTVAVPDGESDVIVTYPGTFVLHSAWLTSIGLLALWPWMLGVVQYRQPKGAGPDNSAERRHDLGAGICALWRRHRRATCLAGGTAAVLATIAIATYRLNQEYRNFGSLRLTLTIPRHVMPRSEPLLTLGQPGAADCIYLIHEDGKHIRIGLDHWGVGGPVSDPIPVDYADTHRLEITIGGLYPPSRWFERPPPPQSDGKGRALFRVTLDGKTVFNQHHPFHSALHDQMAVGQNPVGSSVSGESFSGDILGIERFIVNP